MASSPLAGRAHPAYLSSSLGPGPSGERVAARDVGLLLLPLRRRARQQLEDPFLDSSTLPNTAPTILVVGRGKAALSSTSEGALDLVERPIARASIAGSLPGEVDGWEAGTVMSFPCSGNRGKKIFATMRIKLSSSFVYPA